MVAPAIAGIDLFKIAGRSIAGWIPSFKTGATSHVRQPFCSQLEERLLLWLEYHPQVACYARGDIGPQFATTYRLPTPKHAPFAIGYAFEGKAHDYLPDVVGMLSSGTLFIAEAGMEDDKRGDRNLAKAEAARRLARLQRGVFWIGTERTLTRQRHYNLVFLGNSRASQRSQAVSRTGGLPRWSKPPSGKSWPMRRPQGICWSIWSGTRWIANCPWPCCPLLRRRLSLLLSPTPCCQHRMAWNEPSLSHRARRCRARPLMPPRCPHSNGTTFTGIGALWSTCLPEHPKPASRRRPVSHGRRWGVS